MSRVADCVRQRLASSQAADERGVSLLLVVVFMTVFSVMTGVLLDFANTGFKTTTAIETIRDEHHALDAAIEAAINGIRGSGLVGLEDPGQPGVCVGFNDLEYTPPADSGQPDVTVTCTPASSGTFTGGPDDPMPRFAIQAVGTGDCDGIALGGTEPMFVSGGISSTRRLGVAEPVNGGCGPVLGNGAFLHVAGDVYADDCGVATTVDPPRLTVTAGSVLDCDRPVSEAAGVPQYVPASITVDEVADQVVTDPDRWDRLPTCSANGEVATFVAGVYTELPSLHLERAGCGADVWWFQPGVYYFDFPEDPATNAHEAEWAVDQPTKMVGGTPSGWDPATAADVVLSGACSPPSTDGDGDDPGVQFIFGGESHIVSRSNANGYGMELCAGPGGPGRQRIAVFGLSTLSPPFDSGTCTRTPTDGTFAADVAPTSVGDTFANAAGAQEIDSFAGYATAALSSEGNEAASIDFSSFADIPEGSIVTGVHARVRHRQTGLQATEIEATLDLRYLDDDGNQVSIDTIVVPDDLLGLTSFETEELSADLSETFLWKGVNSLVATYSVTADLETQHICVPSTGPPANRCSVTNEFVPEEASDELDGIDLFVEYTPPGFQTLSTTEPILTTRNNNPTALFRGTFFAPSGDLLVNVHGKGNTAFNRGVVANAISGLISDSSTQTESPFSIPGFETIRAVLLTARVGGEPRLRARVVFDDGAIPGRSVEVTHWVVLR